MTRAGIALDVAADRLTVTGPDGVPVLDQVGFEVAAGSAIGVVGPSGAGKSTLARALLGHLPPGLRHESGTLRVLGTAPLGLRGRHLRRFRAGNVAWVGQDPAAQLTPGLRVAQLVGELAPGTRAERHERVTAALQAVGLPPSVHLLARRPHELSGGQRRRVALARILVRDPRLLVLDEPFAGLDASTQDQVVAELTRLRTALSATVIVISHDLRPLRALTDRVVVLEGGRVVEDGPTDRVATRPRTPTGRRLVAGAERVPLRRSPPAGGAAVLEVEGLTAGYATTPDVVRGTHLRLDRGTAVAILGPSGSGKSTLLRAVVGLHEPTAGSVRLHGRPLAARAARRPSEARRAIAYVPQDPAGSLNPAVTVRTSLLRALRHGAARAGPAELARLLATVGLPAELADRRPDELSGGQQQRVALARALAGDPQVLLCDEVTSSLDARAAAGVLDLLDGLRREHGLAIVLATHDLDRAGRVATRLLRLAEHDHLPPTAPEATTTPEDRRALT